MEERKSLLAGNAMTTLSDLMGFMGMTTVDDATKDNLERLINAASAYIETMTDRKFARKEYVENHHPTGYQELCLKQYPIRFVTSVVDTDCEKVMEPDSYSYEDTGEIGVLYKDSGWALSGYYGGLANDMIAVKRCLRVTYEAGYIMPKDATAENPSDLPYDLQYVVWQMVQQQWNLANNGANGLSAFSISDVSWTFDKELSTQVQNVISRYMRWT